MIKKVYKRVTIVTVLLLGCLQLAVAQFDQLQNTNPGIIIITRPGQLGDTLSVWGDVKVSGRYLVPQNTNLIELISITKGPVGYSGGEAFSSAELDVFVSSYNEQLEKFQIETFSLQADEPFPIEMKRYPLQNGDVVTVKVEQKASFFDYFSVIAPILSLGLTTYLVIDRL